MRKALLEEALLQVPKHGWTRSSLEEAARKLGLPPTAHGLVKGEVDLVSFFVERCNDDLKKAPVLEENASNLSRRELLKAVAKHVQRSTKKKGEKKKSC